MMTYTAINIGPIVQTLGMARKPRELWSASYMFSLLMKYIIKSLPEDNIISPAIDKNKHNGIGLYPDRVFVKDAEISYDSIKAEVNSFIEKLGLEEDYFNIMVVSENCDNDASAIEKLNKKLDYLELYNKSVSSHSIEKINKLIQLKYKSELFLDAFDSNHFSIETLAEIAAVELRKDNKTQWQKFVEVLKSDDNEVSRKAYSELPKKLLKSYHKYICVVQADGDNVGKTVSHKDLKDGEVKKISECLLQFGKNAKNAIEEFGGLPIYAGGDDLLFIAPVVGKDSSNILNLLDKLNDESFKCVADKVDELKLKTDDQKDIHASLSFGVSISYNKYPLYEALENARRLLFQKAKHIKGKNAIALELRKHSGGSFYMELSKSNKALKEKFNDLVENSNTKESVISAVSHKIRNNEGLLKLWIGSPDTATRNENFFKKFIEYKSGENDLYKEKTLKLLNELCLVEHDASKLVKSMYGMLRLAKFINGEEVIDE